MNKAMVIQGRRIGPDEIELIRRLCNENPAWHRKRLSKELCAIWNWHTANGQCKDMACRSLLLKLEKFGHILLPPRRCSANNDLRNQSFLFLPHEKTPIQCALKTLTPIRIQVVEKGRCLALWKSLISQYHYLGYSGSVGENLKYLIRDQKEIPLGCLLFSAAAWKIAPRDAFIGWQKDHRQRNLCFLANNSRFLILPWVRVPHLASHILGKIAQRIRNDWEKKYAHPIYLLETFVERQRFGGICYKAANWQRVGQTQGRTRNDRDHLIRTPIKDVYLYPLSKDFRKVLTQ